MTELKTQASLLTALKRSSERGPSEDELRKQRVSFIMGAITDPNSITRARVEEILDAQEGRKAS